MHNKKTIFIAFLSVIFFTLSVIAILVWVVNTLSQNTAITTKLITSQINRLLDLDSQVENPRAYVDWDMQYKIRADKLTFIHEKEDLISVEDLEVNIFIPYFVLKKIYITQMNGSNLFVNFVRSDENKLNIVEIFNISGFFKVYFKNSSISIDKYLFSFKDNFHKPAEKMLVQGNNILLTKFTLNKYLQLIMDGNIFYNKQHTPFSINYNAKIPTIKKDYNLELNLPEFNADILKNYIKEFMPDLNLSAKGNIKFKTFSGKYFHIDTKIKDVLISHPKMPIKFDFRNEVEVSSKFSFENNNFVIDKLNFNADDIDVSAYGKINDITSLPLDLSMHVKVNNTNGNSVLKILPNGIPVMNYAIDKAKKHNVGANIDGEAFLRGKIGYLLIDGDVKVRNGHLGYGYDLPPINVDLKFIKDKMYVTGKHYPNYNLQEYITINGDIKIVKPIVLNLQINSQPNMDLISVQRALNIYSDVFNFPTGPVPLLDIRNGRGEIELLVKGTPPNVNLDGQMKFYNGIVGYPELRGFLYDVKGNIDFAGENIFYKNISGMQDGIKAYAYGQTQILKNGLTHFYLDIPTAPLDMAKDFVDSSPLLEEVSQALKIIKNPLGTGYLKMVLISEKDTLEPDVEGTVGIINGSCDIDEIAYRATDVNGKVDFTTLKSNIDITGKVHGVDAKLIGFASKNYSEIDIITPNADVNKAYDFIYNSPMFVDMKSSFDDFSNFSGNIKTTTRLYGDLNKEKPDFITNIDVISGKLRYLDLQEDIMVTSGKVVADQNKVVFKDIKGTALNTPYTLYGTIKNAGLPNEEFDLQLEMDNISLSDIKKVVGTKLLTNEVNNLLSKLSFNSGSIDLHSYMTEKETKANLTFNDALATYIPTNEMILMKSGEFFFSEDELIFKNVLAQMEKSRLLADGSVKNYQSNPLFDLNLTSTLDEKDFNGTIAKEFNIPLILAGKIHTDINFIGHINDWNIKLQAMLDETSNIFYQGANIGEGFSRNMYFDISGNDDDIDINELNVFAPDNKNINNSTNFALVKGKIRGLKSQFPYIDNLKVKFNEFMNISFLNILFYTPSKPEPLLTDGKLKADVVISGDVRDVSIIGNANIKDAFIPSISTKVEQANIIFNKDNIEVNDAIVDIAGSKAIITSKLKNKITSNIYIEELFLNSDLINVDEILGKFKQIISTQTKKVCREKSIDIPLPPIIIEKGEVDIVELIYNGLVANNVKADFSADKNWLFSIKNLKADITDGDILGDVDYNFYTSDLKGNIALDNVMANAFATSFLNLPNEIHGSIDANVKFTTKGRAHNDIIENLNGFAYFTLDKGRMLRLGSIEYMLRIANIFKGGIARLNLNAIINIVAPKTGYFDEIAGDIEIKDGIIMTDKITFKSSELNLFLTGSYNMNNSIVNGTIIGQMPMESTESILWLGSLGKISLNSLIRQLTKTASKEFENHFMHNPLAYINQIPGLKNANKDYRFFVVTLKGNLYNDKYVEKFKWIK